MTATAIIWRPDEGGDEVYQGFAAGCSDQDLARPLSSAESERKAQLEKVCDECGQFLDRYPWCDCLREGV